MDSMFDILSDLPLFRGVTRERIAMTVGAAKFHFLKYSQGDTIVRAGEQCTHIKFVISGSVTVSIANPSDRFRISQRLVAPDVISPDFLFGSTTLYPGDVVAAEETGIVQVSKEDYINLLASDKIYMFNLLNYLSMNAQKTIEGILAISSGSIEERLAMWIVSLTQPNAQDITITCKQRDLYAMLGVQRSSYMAALDNLVAAGAISYKPGEIKVADRRMMLSIMRNGIE
ncbi:MAG: Crp/Fnr family transcriptional regulator [Clostridium sp.]|nr:Crp/Fnr family transcriptional regulator [Clostridium sp.]